MFYSLFIISKLFVTIQYFSGFEACGMDIGKRMKELRIQYGLTQQELADRSELTKGFISQLERNQNTPSIGTLLDIIQCLGTTPAEFFTDEEPEQIVFKNEDFFTKVNEDKHNIIEWVSEEDIETLYNVVVKFIPENVPLPDEIEAIERADKSIAKNGTVPHDAVDWD